MILAVITLSGLVHALLFLIVFGVVIWALWTVAGLIPSPVLKTVAQVLITVFGVVILINWLLGFFGEPLIRW